MKIASHPRNPSTQQQFGIWPKVAPGTEFFAAETGDLNTA
jgi:hypothetical protein